MADAKINLAKDGFDISSGGDTINFQKEVLDLYDKFLDAQKAKPGLTARAFAKDQATPYTGDKLELFVGFAQLLKFSPESSRPEALRALRTGGDTLKQFQAAHASPILLGDAFTVRPSLGLIQKRDLKLKSPRSTGRESYMPGLYIDDDGDASTHESALFGESSLIVDAQYRQEGNVEFLEKQVGGITSLNPNIENIVFDTLYLGQELSGSDMGDLQKFFEGKSKPHAEADIKRFIAAARQQLYDVRKGFSGSTETNALDTALTLRPGLTHEQFKKMNLSGKYVSPNFFKDRKKAILAKSLFDGAGKVTESMPKLLWPKDGTKNKNSALATALNGLVQDFDNKNAEHVSALDDIRRLAGDIAQIQQMPDDDLKKRFLSARAGTLNEYLGDSTHLFSRFKPVAADLDFDGKLRVLNLVDSLLSANPGASRVRVKTDKASTLTEIEKIKEEVTLDDLPTEDTIANWTRYLIGIQDDIEERLRDPSLLGESINLKDDILAFRDFDLSHFAQLDAILEDRITDSFERRNKIRSVLEHLTAERQELFDDPKARPNLVRLPEALRKKVNLDFDVAKSFASGLEQRSQAELIDALGLGVKARELVKKRNIPADKQDDFVKAYAKHELAKAMEAIRTMPAVDALEKDEIVDLLAAIGQDQEQPLARTFRNLILDDPQKEAQAKLAAIKAFARYATGEPYQVKGNPMDLVSTKALRDNLPTEVRSGFYAGANDAIAISMVRGNLDDFGKRFLERLRKDGNQKTYNDLIALLEQEAASPMARALLDGQNNLSSRKLGDGSKIAFRHFVNQPDLTSAAAQIQAMLSENPSLAAIYPELIEHRDGEPILTESTVINVKSFAGYSRNYKESPFYKEFTKDFMVGIQSDGSFDLDKIKDDTVRKRLVKFMSITADRSESDIKAFLGNMKIKEEGFHSLLTTSLIKFERVCTDMKFLNNYEAKRFRESRLELEGFFEGKPIYTKKKLPLPKSTASIEVTLVQLANILQKFQ